MYIPPVLCEREKKDHSCKFCFFFKKVDLINSDSIDVSSTSDTSDMGSTSRVYRSRILFL